MASRIGINSETTLVAPPPGRMPQFYFRQGELCFVRRDRQIAGVERPIPTAKAPTVDHGDRRFLKPPQAPPPAICLALGPSNGSKPFFLGLAKVFLEVHACRPAVALSR